MINEELIALQLDIEKISRNVNLEIESYEAIEEKEYNKQVKKLGRLTFGVIHNEEAEVDKFCNNDSCEIPGEDLTSEN